MNIGQKFMVTKIPHNMSYIKFNGIELYDILEITEIAPNGDIWVQSKTNCPVCMPEFFVIDAEFCTLFQYEFKNPFYTKDVIKDLLHDMYNNSEPTKNYIKALENIVKFLEQNPNILPDNLNKFEDQYLVK